MSRHLSDAVLVEMAEEGGRHPHLQECCRCRGRLDELVGGLQLAKEADVEEPSPLFWEHFSARLHGVIDAGQPGDRRRQAGWWLRPAWRPAALAALVVLVAAVSVAVWHGRTVRVGPPVAGQARPLAGIDQAPVQVEDYDESLDASWSLVTDFAAQVDLDTATEAGLVLGPDTADEAVAELSPEERAELVRVLRSALEEEQ
jgi:hypothetical protein